MRVPPALGVAAVVLFLSCARIGLGAGRVLVFSKTAGFRHDSIPDGIAAIRGLGAEHGFAVDATEDASVFDDARPRCVCGGRFPEHDRATSPTRGSRPPSSGTSRGRGFVGVHPRPTRSTTGPGTAGSWARTSRGHPGDPAGLPRCRRSRASFDADPADALSRHRRVVQLSIQPARPRPRARDRRRDDLTRAERWAPIIRSRGASSTTAGATWYTALGHTRGELRGASLPPAPARRDPVRGGISRRATAPETRDRCALRH